MKICITIILISFALTSIGSAKNRQVCDNLTIDSPEKIRFSANEKRLLCGDPKVEAWKTLPLHQIEKHLKGFLQERGYFNVQFLRTQNHVRVVTGKWTKITSVAFDGATPKGFALNRKRKFLGERLTPKILTIMEEWTQNEMLGLGYACSEISIVAQGETGEVLLTIDRGNPQYIQEVFEEPIAGLKPNTLRRFDAFQIGSLYNGQLIQLTAKRAENDGIVQNIQFLHECTDHGLILIQKTIAGPKRLLITGFGANTEGAILGKASLKFSRMDSLGSSVQLSAFASLQKQTAQIAADWYLLSKPSRWFLHPAIEFRREDEPQYEYISSNVRFVPAASLDSKNHNIKLIWGPQFTLTRTFEGAEQTFTQFLSAILQLNIITHDFEFYSDRPRTGYGLSFKFSLNHDAIVSDLSVQQFELHGEFLWNLMDLDPSLLVLGIRGDLATTITDTNHPDIGKLPPSFRYFRGGSANLRGFDLGELPNSSPGALTAAYLGFEARLVEVLPWHLQPLVFLDGGFLGRTSFNLDQPLYWSPGGGLRWASPVGVFRGTMAHGFTHGNNISYDDVSHWQFYLSFGEEF